LFGVADRKERGPECSIQVSAVDVDDDCVSGDCDDVYSSEDLYLA
jgi:hypothetical protein